jgi:flagellar hook-basal body complex protein FliE
LPELVSRTKIPAMTDHSDSSHEPGHPSAPASSISASVLRLGAAIFRGAGYTKTADAITGWPELLGGKIGEALKKLRNAESSGQPITMDAEKELENAMKENPAEAAQVLGAVMASVVGQPLSAEAESKQILDSYSFVLDTVADAMAASQTSFALRGFVNRADCISYWHRNLEKPKFLKSAKYLQPGNFDIFLLELEPTPKDLETLNILIRRDRQRHLPAELYDYRNNGAFMKLKEIRELEIAVDMLHPQREELKLKPDPLHMNFKYDFPTEFTFEIPFGAPDLAGVFESFFEAKRIQDLPRTELEKTKSSVKEIMSKAQPRS